MKKIVVSVLGALAFAMLASCTSVTPVCATGNAVGSKVGTAQGMVILGLPVGYDCGIQKAAAEGGITQISTVDSKVVNFLLFQKVTTVVTGE